jgi:hypothetical protein
MRAAENLGRFKPSIRSPCQTARDVRQFRSFARHDDLVGHSGPVADHVSVLTHLAGYVEYRYENTLIAAVALDFDQGKLVVEVNPDDDTVAIRLSQNVELLHWADAIAYERTDESPWSSRLGANCVWRWLLTNQQGYQDGAQVELSRDGQYFVVQWIAQASSLRTAQVVVGL